MKCYSKLTFAIATLLYSTTSFSADKETKALLQQLTKQIAELKQQSNLTDAKMRELENNLKLEQEKNRQFNNANHSIQNASIEIPPVETPKIAPIVSEKLPEKPAVTLGDVKGTFKVPGTNTSLGFGGFVKMDVAESNVSAGHTGGNESADYQLIVSEIPLSSNHAGENSQLAFNARESRFWLKSFTPSQWGDINTYLEFDLYGSTTAYTPRLRHAYGSFGHLLAGFTWTTFINDLALPDTLDNGGPSGSIRVRQPVVRWTQPFEFAGAEMRFQAAIESPESRILNDQNTATLNPDSNRYPDLIARLDYKPHWGVVTVAAMGRNIRVSSPSAVNQEQWGGAVNLTGKINVLEQDNIRFSLNYGNSLSRYLNYPFEDATVLSNRNEMELTTSYSTALAYQHWWNDAWRSTIAYGFQQADRFHSVNDLMTQQAQSLHANLLWNPLPQATLGIEYIHAIRDTQNGQTGELNRALMSAKYDF